MTRTGAILRFATITSLLGTWRSLRRRRWAGRASVEPDRPGAIASARRRTRIAACATFEIMLEDDRHLDCLEAGDPGRLPAAVPQRHAGLAAARAVAGTETCAAAPACGSLSFSRAGYGASTPQPGRSVADVAGDSAAVLDAAGVGRFAVWGHSAAAGRTRWPARALLGDRVTVCVSSAGVAPYDAEGLDWSAGMGEANIEEFGLLRRAASTRWRRSTRSARRCSARRRARSPTAGVAAVRRRPRRD